LTSAEDLAQSIGVVGAVAKQSSTSIQDLEGYTTALVSSMGIQGSEAGTALKSMISRVFRLGSEGAEDAGKAEETLKGIGVAVRDTSGSFRAFSDIIKDTQNKFSGLNNVQQMAVAQAVGG
jgi:TP901 family phage tail tape measure protein